ncbi:hypothetical protein R1sor_026612 [Riccia sorocarpa]|uniref:Reverse transcriptase zinc-binding domain-containing protein n=1 Tax=Riccia sorocarpa TaxID=122646 RepID=A0ABD3GDY3_9MARC
MPNTFVLVDYTVTGRRGAALLIPQHLPILDHGTSGTGNAAWVEVNTIIGPIKVISVHAPNTKNERTILWDRIQDIVGDGRWIMVGDFNMVELYEDSKGKSALVSGAEARSWKHLAENKRLVDAYLCAVTMTEGLFTRQVFCGQRYDRARLDRIYLSEGAEWLEVVKEVSHKSDQVVSDHVPVTFDCRLHSDGDRGWRPKSYFKMGASVLYRPGVKQKVLQAWDSHPLDAGNPQRRWELGWIRVREILRQEKRKMEAENRQCHDLRLQVLSLRLMLESDQHTNEFKEQLIQAEDKLRKMEQADAKAWRTRRKERWLREGEAPTRYFYAQATAKFTRESIQALKLEDGTTTTDREKIMAEVGDYYTKLFQSEETTPHVLAAREEALQALTKRVSAQQDQRVSQNPTLEEVKIIVRLLPKDKRPGLDGLTVMALLLSWDRIKRVLSGIEVLDDKIAADIKTQYEGRINHWATKMLNWPAKIIMCKIILGTLPYYTLMTVGLSKPGMKMLQKVTRDFLWGTNETGRRKKPQIAWMCFHAKKEDSGLGWPNLEDMAHAFLLKNITKLLTGGEEEWIKIAEAIIKKAMQDSTRTNEIKQWSVPEILLGLDSFQTRISPTLDKMLKAWYAVKKKLRWLPKTANFPYKASPTFIAKVAEKAGVIRPHETRLLTNAFRKARISNTQQIWEHQNENNYLAVSLQWRGQHVSAETTEVIGKYLAAFPTGAATNSSWAEAHGWAWSEDKPMGKEAWKLPIVGWRSLMYTCKDDTQKINGKWEAADNNRRWKNRWSKLWNGTAKTRTKLRLWRYLRQGYFTNSKAYEWGLADGLCQRCGVEKETYLHAIWECPRICERVSWLCWLLYPEESRTTSAQGTEKLLEVIDIALSHHSQHQAQILLLMTALRINRAERNEAQFKRKINFRGITNTIEEARNEVMTLHSDGKITRKQDEMLQRTLQTIEYWMQETSRWLAGDTARSRQPPFQITTTSNIAPDQTPAMDNLDQQWPIDRLIELDQEETQHWDGNRIRQGAPDFDDRGRRRRSPKHELQPPLHADQRASLRDYLHELFSNCHLTEAGPNVLHFDTSEELLDTLFT